MKMTAGGTKKIVYNELNFKKAYYDEYTGEMLPEKLVRAAIIEELNYFSEEGVWEGADYSELKGNPKGSCTDALGLVQQRKREMPGYSGKARGL